MNNLANDFFKHGDKGYAENLNDGLLVGNAFSWTLSIGLPSDTEGVFPNSSSVVKAKVCDVSATPNSNLGIGSTITNSSGSEQVYRLTVYPNFNRFGGFTSVSVTGDADLFIANKGASSPIVDNLDYSDLGNVPELKVLKEYDIVLTLSDGDSVSGLSFVLQSKAGGVSASISQSNVAGLESALTGLNEGLDDVETGVSNNLSKINTLSMEVWDNTSQTGTSRIDSLVDSVSSLSTSIANLNTYTTYIDNENYTVKYNDYRVIIDVHLSSTTFPTTLTAFNDNLIPSDCRPSQPVVVFLQNVNAIVSVRENSNGIYRKSITGSAIGSGGCYCHIEYSRV